MSINWYPGHMKKTKELIEANLKLVDVVVELLDSRIPISSRNPQFNPLLGQKKRVVALNKYDLSDQNITREWIKYYEEQGVTAVPINAISGAGIKQLMSEILLATEDLREKIKKQGRMNRPIRLMIIGIPNVGKSTLINKLAGKNVAKAGNRPGVTKGKQWIRLNKELELFDTPGILWPKIEEDITGIKLACSGAIKDEVLNIEDIAYHLLKILSERYPEALKTRYQLDELPSDPLVLMDEVGRKRGCLARGNQIDYEKVSRLVLDEFRKGRLGGMTLERVEDLVIADEEHGQ